VTQKLPSIRTVAHHAGVSTATVSNVLNARRSVAPHLAARVHAAVAELGYIADVGAARLRSRKSSVVGTLVPDIANPFFGAFVAGLEGAARRDGFDLLAVSSGRDPAQETARLRALLTWRPAGLIIIPCDDALNARSLPAAMHIPVVAADRIPSDPDFDVVAVNNREMAACVARHLLEQGHRQILIVTSSLTISNIRERWAGVRDAVQENSSVEAELVEVGFTLAGSRAHLDARLAGSRMPTAILSLNYTATLATLGAAAARGLSMPGDLALAGFDEDEWMRVVVPRITAVRQPVEDLAQAAWRRLMARVAGDDTPPREVRLACSFEVRESSTLARRVPDVAVMRRRPI
jgi:DNA-binding LacI/PurR family transcriptional regulator